MPNVYQVGRTGRVYVAKEASYGTAATLAAGDALRHLNLRFAHNPRNRVNSPERTTHRSQITKFTRRKTADWMISGILFPSGTLNTVPDMDPILETVFGSSAARNITLSTTVAVGGAGTATADTLTSTTGLAVGDPILINHQTDGLCVRWIQTLPGANALTWAPALSSAVSDGQSVKGCIGYNLTTAIGASLNMAHYRSDISYEMGGCSPDYLKLSFDNNDEVMFEASGPAQKRTRPAQTDPSTFTVVGSTPPSGLTGYLRANTTAEEFLKASFEIKNGIETDNRAFGTSQSQGHFIPRKREVLVNINTMVSNDTTLIDLAEATTDFAVMLQCGLTQGSIIAIYCPIVELDVPDEPDADETTQHDFKGVAKGSGSGNNEIFLAFA